MKKLVRATTAPLVAWCTRHGFYRWLRAEEHKIEHAPSMASDLATFRVWQATPEPWEPPLA